MTEPVVRYTLVISTLLFAAAAGAQPMSLTSTDPNRPTPFASGESLRYDATFGRIKVGEGRLEVVGIEQVRGRAAWHLVFSIRGGVPFYRIDDRLESWVDTATMSSLRFTRRLNEGRRERDERFEIYPERGVFEVASGGTSPTVANPLDDGAFFYFVRTLPLRTGDSYTINRYFRPDRNPVRVAVVRRERIRVPAGEFDTIVLRPVINTPGMLSQARRTELWMTDDDSRMLVQVQSHLPFGTITLKLTSARRGGSAPVIRTADAGR